MPGCPCCPPPVDYDPIFNDRAARDELRAYRRDGPQGTTRRLIDALVAEGVKGAAVLDVGAGVGVVGFELLDAGASSLTDIDASHAYLDAARSEAERRGLEDRATFHFGDFVGLAPSIDLADVVALDRVVCCYGDARALAAAAVDRSQRVIGLVYPIDRWWIRLGIRVANLALRVGRQSYRGYVHPVRVVDGAIRSGGFERVFLKRGWIWQVVVYRRVVSIDGLRRSPA
ncbi:MAG: methyltransferase domain-containing protein [Chloroflexota bacterium]